MSGKSHLVALLKKNYMLWKRNWIFSIIEVGFPLGIACFLFLFRSEVDRFNIEEKSYVNEALYFYSHYPLTSEIIIVDKYPLLP